MTWEPAKTWIIYALGGGWGHLNRALALGQIPQVRHTAAWLIRSASALPDINKARLLLRLNPADCRSKIVVVCAAGQAEELVWYGKLTGTLAESLTGVAVRCLAATCPENCPPDLWIFHWPGIECLLAADVVVGGGYNTFYECAALKVPLVAFAMNRRYDRQDERVEQLTTAQRVESIDDAVAAVRHCLNCVTIPKSISSHQLAFTNGAISAACLIEQAIAENI